MKQLSKGEQRRAEEDAAKIIQALQVLFGEDRVMSCALVESFSDQASATPLGLVMGALVRSKFKDLVMKTASGG